MRGWTREPETRTLKETRGPPSVAATPGRARPHTCVRTCQCRTFASCRDEGGSRASFRVRVSGSLVGPLEMLARAAVLSFPVSVALLHYPYQYHYRYHHQHHYQHHLAWGWRRPTTTVSNAISTSIFIVMS